MPRPYLGRHEASNHRFGSKSRVARQTLQKGNSAKRKIRVPEKGHGRQTMAQRQRDVIVSDRSYVLGLRSLVTSHCTLEASGGRDIEWRLGLERLWLPSW